LAGQPTKIGKYDILREIGRGGMGKVYGAVDPTIGRMVAIKQVTAVVSDDPDLLKRFYREAQSTGKLQHPNIVTLHDLGEQDGIPYLVMEYLEGDSLERIIQERRPYTVAEKLNIIIQVCEGLAYAHQRQIIHRDIKPGNIVVLNDGGVKIVDFGIAQFGNERYTRTGQVVGSLYYMSPEQIQDADIDSRSDIYSTGIVLYEFLTGSVPFRGKDPASTLAKILHDSPPSVANSVDVYQAELDAIVRRALAKDRNSRYTSMEDFAFDLRSLEEKLSQDLIANFLRATENFIAAKQWEKAREQLRQILKLDKQHRRANELLREVQTQIHRQQVGEQVRQLRLRADEALGLRNWEEALAALDQAIKIDNSNTELIRFRDSVYRSSTLLTDALRRAESAHNAGDLDGAKRAVEEALNVDPYNTTAKALNAILSKELNERSKRKKIDELVGAARKEIALRHFTAALEMLRAGEAMDASAPEIQQLIRSATAGLEHERRRAALEKACAEIEDLLNRDEYSAACEKADEALVAFPQDLGLLKLKGFAEKQREAWTRRQFLEAQIATARQLTDSGELLRAQRILNEALERYPDDSGVISLLGIVTDGLARQEAQRKEAERQANERRRYIRTQLAAAAELQQAGQTAEALKKIREGLVHYPDNEELKQRASALEESLAREETLRKQAEQEAQRKRAEIEKTIAESWQLLSSKQTGQAVALLDQALRRHPDSADLKSQLEFAQRRLAVARAERERAEQEAKRRAAEIQKEAAAGQRLLDSRQTDQAITALEHSLSRYSESEELKSLLQAAYRRQTAERAEREVTERESRQKHAEIEKEIVAARELLDAKHTSESVTRLEKALARYPDSEEIKGQLSYARQRLAAEEAAREKGKEEERRRRAWVDAEISVTRQWVADKQADRAVTKLQQALGQFPENELLKSELESAMRRAAQEKADREEAERKAQRQREEIHREIRSSLELLDGGKPAEAVASLEKAILRFPQSPDLRSQLDHAKSRFAEEEAKQKRAAEEARRRQEEIDRALLSARQFIESEQTSRAVTALELAFQRYPDSTELKSQLERARQRLAAEEAERLRIEQEQRRRQEEIKKEIAAAVRLRDSGQLVRAAASLEDSLRRIPDSEELKAQLTSAKDRIAAEEAAKQRAEQEKRRREAEIASALAGAQKLLDSKQTAQAAQALELAARKYPESEPLRELLDSTQATLAQEHAAQEKAEREAQERRQKLASEIENAKHLLLTNQTSKALRALEEALERYPESEGLRLQLAAGKEQQAREIAEREKAEKRQAQLQAERAKVQSLLDGGEPESALSIAEAALRALGQDVQLQQLVESAKGALKLKKAEEKKRAAEREQEEQKKRQRERELADLKKLAASAKPATKQHVLEKLLRKADQIGARHRDDAEFQKNLSEVKAALGHMTAEARPSESVETRLATKFFATHERVEEPAAPSAAARPVPRAVPPSPSAGLAVKLLNKWTAIAVVGLIVVGVGLKLLIPSKPQTYVVNIESEPAGATIRIGDQTCVTPNCRLSLPAGEYKLDGQLNGYQHLSQSVTVDAQNPTSQLKLVFVVPPPPETAGYLVIKAGMSGADVLINGNRRAQTVAGGTLRLPLDPGTYAVAVEKKGFVTAKSSSVQIVKGQDTTAVFTLSPLPTVSELEITQAIPNVQVLTDGHEVGRTDSSGTFSQSIEPGTHEIVLMQDGRRSNAIRTTFIAGRRVDLNGKSFAISPPPRAMVAVTHLPSGAIVKVEGTTYSADQSGTVRFDIVTGEHTLDIGADGYKSRQIQRSFAAGTISLDGSLERLDLEGPEWAKVENSSDMTALQGFLNSFPKGRNAQQAQSRLDNLIARDTSEKELKAFYERFPNTPAAEAAEKRLEALRGGNKNLLTDRDIILSLVGRLEQAYSDKNAGEVCGIWPKCPREELKKVFKEATSISQKFELTPPMQIPEGQGVAIATFRRTRSTVYPKSKPFNGTDTVTIHFRKQGSSWQIDSIE
jgi:eukaryotic-like serine/threonine-protein kinase